MTTLIGISGKPGSAKNHFGFKIIQETRYQGYNIIPAALASTLYEETNALIDGITEGRNVQEALNIPKTHYAHIGTLLRTTDIGSRNPEWGWDRRNATVRQIFQILGTEIRREQNPNYLIEALIKKIPEGTDFALFTDLRFPNEANYVNTHQGVTLRAEINEKWVSATTTGNDGFKYSQEGLNHPTETALDD